MPKNAANIMIVLMAMATAELMSIAAATLALGIFKYIISLLLYPDVYKSASDVYCEISALPIRMPLVDLLIPLTFSLPIMYFCGKYIKRMVANASENDLIIGGAILILIVAIFNLNAALCQFALLAYFFIGWYVEGRFFTDGPADAVQKT